MKVPKIFSAIAAAAAILFASSIGAEAAPKAAYVEGVDWTNKVVTVTGEGLVPKDAVNHTQARGLAVAAAKADAYRKLGELINGVRVEGETTVEKMLTTKDVIKMRVSATIKGAKIVDETFLSDGGYRIVMQVPLFGVTNSLAGAVLERTSTIEPFPDPVGEIAPTQYGASNFARTESTAPITSYTSPLSRMSLPSADAIILQKMQAYQQTLPVANSQIASDTPRTQMVRRSVEEYASAAEGDYTGLIVDCRGLDLQPVMSPVIKNENGTKIYGHKNLDIDKIIAQGVADYIKDPANVERAGVNPLVVRAVRVDDFNSNPVVSLVDSNRILIENHVTRFLQDYKVVFLCD